MAEEEVQTEEITTDVEEPEESLESILSGEEAEEQPAQEEEKPAKEAAAEEKEEGPAKGEEKPAAGDADLTDEQIAALPVDAKGLYEAKKAEKKKRQALEGTNIELVANNQKLTGQVEQLLELLKKPGDKKEEVTAEEVKSFWDDPEGFIAKAVEGASGNTDEIRKEAQNLRLDTSELLAKSRHEDYDEVYGLFASAVANHPNKDEARAAMQAITTSRDPAEAAYQQGLKLKSEAELAEAGGIDALVAKRVAEGLAAAKNTAEEDEADEIVKSALPTSMANRRASGGAAKPTTEFDSEMSMSEILGGR